MSLLPPNATAGERALEGAMDADIDIAAVGTLWNPAACPADVLPFLAWGLAISHWDATWTEAQKRSAIAAAIPFHRKKGTRATVEQVLARFHPLLKVVEWWEGASRRKPHTFEVRAPAGPGGIPADFLTSETAAAIIRDVAAAKPLRSHFDFVQNLEIQGRLWLAGAAAAGTSFRSDATTDHDTSRDWSIVLQTEEGEPIYTVDHGDVLETS